MTPGNPLVGGTVLRRPAIQSPNYVAGVSGWTINQDGSAEFNNLTIRGEFVGSNYVISSSGAFFYSGTPAANNLIASITTAAGTDGFGNNYLAEVSSYGSGFASSVAAGALEFYSGSLAGGWTLQGELITDNSGDLVSSFAGSLELSGNLSVSSQIAVGGATITQTNFNMNPPMGSTSSITVLVSEMANRGMVT